MVKNVIMIILLIAGMFYWLMSKKNETVVTVDAK